MKSRYEMNITDVHVTFTPYYGRREGKKPFRGQYKQTNKFAVSSGRDGKDAMLLDNLYRTIYSFNVAMSINEVGINGIKFWGIKFDGFSRLINNENAPAPVLSYGYHNTMRNETFVLYISGTPAIIRHSYDSGGGTPNYVTKPVTREDVLSAKIRVIKQILIQHENE